MMAIEEVGTLLVENDQTSSDLITSCIDRSNYKRLWYICFCLALGNAIDAIEIMCIGYVVNKIDDGSEYQKEILTAAVFMGMLFGGFICGFISDIVGRRPTLLISFIVNTFAGFLSSVAPNIESLILLRIIGGLGIGGSVPIVFSLGAELFPSLIRGKMLSFIASFWMVGAIYTALVAWLILGDNFAGQRIYPGGTWRIFTTLCAVPVLCTLIISYIWIPESPRFLVHRGKYKEASKILIYLCDTNITEQDLREAYSTIKNTDTPTNNTQSSEESSNKSHTTSFLTTTYICLRNPCISVYTCILREQSIRLLFSTQWRKITLILICIWFTLCFGSYGLTTWIVTLFSNIGLSNPYADGFIFALGNLPGNLFSIYYIEVFGRRKLLSMGMSLAAVSTLLCAVDLKNTAIVVITATLFNVFSVIGWNSLDCMSVEYFPTSSRTTAMGILASSGRLGAVAGQFVDGSLQTNIPLLLSITTLCMIIGGLLAWILPDDHIISKITTNESLDIRDNTSSSTSTYQDSIVKNHIHMNYNINNNNNNNNSSSSSRYQEYAEIHKASASKLGESSIKNPLLYHDFHSNNAPV